jgi:acetyltransferase-like isoleucine patch superfamily enzyme
MEAHVSGTVVGFGVVVGQGVVVGVGVVGFGVVVGQGVVVAGSAQQVFTEQPYILSHTVLAGSLIKR